jgi:hypothetical protein
MSVLCNKCGSTKDTSKVVDEFKIPFKCSECGSIDFPYKALNGIVFVWSELKPEKIGSLYLPERLNQPFTSHYGVVLSSGKGVKEKKTGRFIASELETGDIIWRDKDTPWAMDIEAQDGKRYSIPYMNILDIWTKCIN